METPQFILIDASYFIFYRYYAISRWYQKSNLGESAGIPIENPTFVEKFRKIFQEKLRELPSKLGMPNAIIIVATDCNYDNIWRVKHFPDYKIKREKGKFEGPFFNLVFREDLFRSAFSNNFCKIISHEHLEADDCIAVFVKQVAKDFDTRFVVIANDRDFLQLAVNSKVEIRDAQLKLLKAEEHSLFVKIVTGDQSDNIPSIFPRCGEKTALKYFHNREEFEKRLAKENAQEKFELNMLLIDFDFIPQKYADELIQSL